MRQLVFCYLIFLSLLIPSTGISQILAPNANYSDTSAYAGQDSLYVFNIDNEDAYIIVDTLSYPNQAITWEEYIPGTGFVAMGTTEPRIDISTSTATQGYRLTLPDTTVICWVMINDFTVEVLSKDAEGNITKDALTSSDCVWIGYIEVEYTRNSLNYYHPIADTLHTLRIGYSSDYSTDPDPTGSYGVLYEADPLNGKLRFGINNSWWEDAIYDIEITDDAGLMRSDDVNVTAIRPRAEFEAPEHIQLNNKEFYPDRDTLFYRAYNDDYHQTLNYKSAPGLYMYVNGAYNADSIVWHFGDSISFTTSKDTIFHEYYSYGVYQVWMEAINYFENRLECYDVSDKTQIELSVPELKAPNVFTPPGGDNPIWRYEDVSITDFEIAIYNRYGRRVHSFKGNIRDWGGWDGSANNSSSYVSTGVYFYILKDFSHSALFNEVSNDNVPDFDATIYKGAIHVYNTQ